MEKFMFIFRGGRQAELSAEEAQAHMQKWFAWMDELRAKGIVVSTSPLLPAGKVLSGKSKVITDGPFLEAKEIVGGYTVITAASIDEAVVIAGDCPIFEVDGKVEVRPLREIVRP
jgi:hypothetical protein